MILKNVTLTRSSILTFFKMSLLNLTFLVLKREKILYFSCMVHEVKIAPSDFLGGGSPLCTFPGFMCVIHPIRNVYLHKLCTFSCPLYPPLLYPSNKISGFKWSELV